MYDFQPLKKELEEAKAWLKRELDQIRTGRASGTVLDMIRVNAYGSFLSIREVASVSTEDARVLRIAPWDMGLAKEIEKAITTSDIGVSVSVDDKGLRVIFPDLTGERRIELVKLAKGKLEEARIALRRGRDVTVKDLQNKEKEGGYGKDDIFRLKGDVEKMMADAGKALEDEFTKKEKEILG